MWAPLCIVLIAAAAAVVTELVSYAVLYRKPAYQALKAEVEALNSEGAPCRRLVWLWSPGKHP